MLSTHMTIDGTSCFPSVDLLAQETKLSKRSVCTHLEKAESSGWISRESKKSSGQAWRQYHYTPKIPEGGEGDSTALSEKVVNEVQQLTLEGGEPLSKGGEPDDIKVVNEVHSSSSKSSSKSSSLFLSELLLNLILKRRKSFKRPDLQKWARHIGLMIKKDGRSLDEIEAVIRWSQKDPFWQNNILSTSKLRNQFDQLAMKMKGGKTQHEQFSEKKYVGTPIDEIGLLKN